MLPNSLYLHPLYNDAGGQTDKLLTGAVKSGFLWNSASFGWETTAAWRLITPAEGPDWGGDAYSQPIGELVDSAEIRTAWAYWAPLQGRWAYKVQTMAGAHHVGNKGARALQSKIHQTIGSRDSVQLRGNYEDTLWTPSLGLQVTLFSDGALLDQQLAIEVTHDAFSRDVSLAYSLLSIGQYAGLGAEARLVQQSSSLIYHDLLTWRQEVSLGLKVFGLYPTVKWISPYLRGDRGGQWYVNPVNFVLPL